MSTSQLARLDQDVTVTDLERIGNTIVTALRDDDGNSRRDLEEAFDRTRGPMARLWPNKVERERQHIAARTMREQAARQAALMEVYAETRLEIARKQADALVASVGTSLQAELAAFAAGRIKAISETINETRNHFMDTYGPQADKVEQYKDRPELYTVAKEQLTGQLMMQFDTLNRLLEGFIIHLQSRVTPSSHHSLGR